MFFNKFCPLCINYTDVHWKVTNSFCVQEVCSGSEDAEELNPFYAPLTCDLCHETFTTPALWVRHVERPVSYTHLDVYKRQVYVLLNLQQYNSCISKPSGCF